MEGSGPTIMIYDRQSRFPLPFEYLTSCSRRALPFCLRSQGPGEKHLAGLSELEVSFVDDEEIARIHGQFMGLPDPTDVITFDHGEIIISTDTAFRYATEYGQELQSELALYIIHGMLHLNGHEDATEEGACTMREIQENILRKVTGTSDPADV